MREWGNGTKVLKRPNLEQCADYICRQHVNRINVKLYIAVEGFQGLEVIDETIKTNMDERTAEKLAWETLIDFDKVYAIAVTDGEPLDSIVICEWLDEMGELGFDIADLKEEV